MTVTPAVAAGEPFRQHGNLVRIANLAFVKFPVYA